MCLNNGTRKLKSYERAFRGARETDIDFLSRQLNFRITGEAEEGNDISLFFVTLHETFLDHLFFSSRTLPASPLAASGRAVHGTRVISLLNFARRGLLFSARGGKSRRCHYTSCGRMKKLPDAVRCLFFFRVAPYFLSAAGIIDPDFFFPSASGASRVRPVNGYRPREIFTEQFTTKVCLELCLPDFFLEVF